MFKKKPKTDYYFQTVKDIYFSPKVKCSEFSNGTMTDELAFQIACMLTGIYPHLDSYTPIYNRFLKLSKHQRMYPYQLANEGFYGYSIGGHRLDEFQKKNYNTLASAYFAKRGLKGHFQAIDKRSFLPERKLL